jgi:hypothetical protein
MLMSDRGVKRCFLSFATSTPVVVADQAKEYHAVL